jgi:signal transduction histidine kinase/ActR/RegA family two-component response regulator
VEPQQTTAKRQRRRRASQADQQLQRIIEQIADAIVVVDGNGRVQFANPAAETLFGEPPGNLVGRDFGFPLVAEEISELDLVGGRVAEMRVVELSWGSKPAWLASLRDVTERHEAEQVARRLWRERTAREEAEKERRRLQDLLVRAPAGILTTRGEDHYCVFANPVIEQLACGRQLRDRRVAEALPELVEHRFLAAFDRAYRSGESQQETELEICLDSPHGGPNRWLDVCWEPLVSEDGQVEGVMCFAHDVTDQVTILHDLERAMERLREDERQKDHFMAMLGHELRNPLAGIDSGLRLLEHGAAGRQADWAVGMMRKQVAQLANLLDDLLDVARIARGKLELQRRVVSLREIVEAVVAAAGPRLAEQNQKLHVSIADGPLTVDGDPARLQQVVSNLLANACRYSDPGTEITLRILRRGGEAVIEVQDHGIGIEPGMVEQIFEPFVQAANESARAGGLGIGLTLVRQLAELHDGRVDVFSAGRDQGSTFTVYLPLQDEPVEVVLATAPRRAENTDCRVLVIDDNEDAGLALAELLTFHGCQTWTAGSGQSGLDLAREVRPDVVLLDIDLPDLDGYHVAKRLREDVGLDPLLIVAVSGFGDEQARARSRASGMDHHLLKPVDLDELLELIARAASER